MHGSAPPSHYLPGGRGSWLAGPAEVRTLCPPATARPLPSAGGRGVEPRVQLEQLLAQVHRCHGAWRSQAGLDCGTTRCALPPPTSSSAVAHAVGPQNRPAHTARMRVGSMWTLRGRTERRGRRMRARGGKHQVRRNSGALEGFRRAGSLKGAFSAVSQSKVLIKGGLCAGCSDRPGTSHRRAKQ